jgi:beta-mannosidase
MRTIEAFTQPEDRTGIFTPVMLAHQKNNEGNSIIHDYLLKDYPEPKDFASFLYVSQVLQAEGIKIGAEHFRRSRPETMGSIFWQLNDCWPSPPGPPSTTTAAGRPCNTTPAASTRPSSSRRTSKTARSRSTSSPTRPKPRRLLRVRLMDFDGKVLLEETHASMCRRSPARSISTGRSRNSPTRARPILRASLWSPISPPAEPQLSRNLVYLAPTKEVHLKPARSKLKPPAPTETTRFASASPSPGPRRLSLFRRSRRQALRQLLRPAARRNHEITATSAKPLSTPQGAVESHLPHRRLRNGAT